MSKIKYSFNSFYSCSKNLVCKKSRSQKIRVSKIRVQKLFVFKKSYQKTSKNKAVLTMDFLNYFFTFAAENTMFAKTNH